jgi:hypothetical protein
LKKIYPQIIQFLFIGITTGKAGAGRSAGTTGTTGTATATATTAAQIISIFSGT